MNQHFEMKGSLIRARRIYDERKIIRFISQFKLAILFVNERWGTDIDDSIEKTEMHETLNYADNNRDYNEIRTNHTPTPETTTSENTPKQSDVPITDETAIATTTKEKETTTTNEARTSRSRRKKNYTKTFTRLYLMNIDDGGEFKFLEVGRNVMTSSTKLTHFRPSAHKYLTHACTHTHAPTGAKLWK